MSGWQRRVVLLGSLLLGGQPALAADAAEMRCGERRQALGKQLAQARLDGDKVRLGLLAHNLNLLTRRCSGLTLLQANPPAVDQAARLLDIREAQLREALGTGDPQLIERRRSQLDQARRQLDAARQRPQ